MYGFGRAVPAATTFTDASTIGERSWKAQEVCNIGRLLYRAALQEWNRADKSADREAMRVAKKKAQAKAWKQSQGRKGSSKRAATCLQCGEARKRSMVEDDQDGDAGQGEAELNMVDLKTTFLGFH